MLTGLSVTYIYSWLRLVETLRTSSNEYEDYEFDDLAANVRPYEPSLALSFGDVLPAANL